MSAILLNSILISIFILSLFIALNMVGIYSREQLLLLRFNATLLDDSYRARVSQFGLQQCGCHASTRYRLYLLDAHSLTSPISRPRTPGEIPIISGRRTLFVNKHQLFPTCREQPSVHKTELSQHCIANDITTQPTEGPPHSLFRLSVRSVCYVDFSHDVSLLTTFLEDLCTGS